MNTDIRTWRPAAGAASSRHFFVVLATVLAVIAAAAVTFLFGGSGDAGTPTAMPSTLPAAEAGGDVDGDLAADVVSSVPLVTYEVFLERDPFEPVVPEPITDPVDTPTDPSDPLNPTDPSDPNPVIPGAPVPGDPDAPRCVGDTELVCDGRVVTLLDTATVEGQHMAIIQVDTTVHEVRVGQRFGDYFEVRAIEPPSITIAYGDATFVLRTGSTVLK